MLAQMTLEAQQGVEMKYALSVVVPAVHFSPAGVAQVEVPVRGLLITRV